MDLLIEKDDKRTYLSRYKVITTSFEESSPSVKRNNTQIQYRNGNVDFGGWNESKTIDYVGYYRADDLEDEEYLRERIYALLSDPEGYYITQLKNDNDNSFERPGETSGDYFDKQVNRPSHKRFYVYASSLESELVGSYGGHVLYKISAKFTTMKLPYGESVPRDLDVKPNVPYIGRNLVLNSDFENAITNVNNVNSGRGSVSTDHSYQGVQSVKVSIDSGITSNDSGVIIRPENAQSNANYTATGWLYSDVSRTLNIRGYSADWSFLSRLSVALAAKTWTKFEYHFTTGISVANAGVAFFVNGKTGIDIQPFYIDLVKIEQGNTPTPWSPAPEDPEYNAWYTKIYYNTDNLVVPYAGTVPCNQLEQGFAIEFTAKEAGSRLVIDVNGTELTYNGQVYSDDVIKLSGYEYTKNDISIVKSTNKAYFKLVPGIANEISSNLHGSIKILGYQDLYA